MNPLQQSNFFLPKNQPEMKASKVFRPLMILIALSTLFFTACNEDKDLFLPETDNDSRNIVRTTSGKEFILETREDTLAWIKEESKDREVHTDYLLEFPPLTASVSGNEIIKLNNPYSGEEMEMEALIIDGKLVVEGDMMFGTEAEYRTKLSRAEGRAAVSNSTENKWEYGIIPYVIENGHPNYNRIKEGIEEINGSYLTMVPRTNEEDYVVFRTSVWNNSSVGRIGGAQTINISNGASKGTVVHEVLHAAGLFHEHTRCDRDDYVNIKWHNIESGFEHNFHKNCGNAISQYGYDFGSVMHYGPRGFSTSTFGNTIEPTTGNPFTWLDQYFTMGQRNGMSGTDWWSVAYLYPIEGRQYLILRSRNSGRFMYARGTDNETVTQQYFGEENYNNYYQYIQPERSEDGFYYLKHAMSGKVLGVKNKSQANSAEVVLQDFTGEPHQQFRFEVTDADNYLVMVRHSGKYLDIRVASKDNGGVLTQYDRHGRFNQQFSIIYPQ